MVILLRFKLLLRNRYGVHRTLLGGKTALVFLVCGYNGNNRFREPVGVHGKHGRAVGHAELTADADTFVDSGNHRFSPLRKTGLFIRKIILSALETQATCINQQFPYQRKSWLA
jgi:hypothetical protein